MKAEENAALSRNEAEWLLSFYRRGGDIQMTDEDVRRLEAITYIPLKGNAVTATDTTMCAGSVIQK